MFFLDRIQPFLFKLLCEALSFANMGGSNALDHLMVQFHSLAMSLVYRFWNIDPLLHNYWNIYFDKFLGELGILSFFDL